ncbi:MAG: hypothetical protein UZ17_ACD001001140 [Acidobacteria bacterium OLB17]|nr:MAG: hypothetical protein UZ17_ACD001001140 [Acidobacteria bacterium OLB17]
MPKMMLTREHLPGFLKRNERVCERRLRRVVRDGVDLFKVLGHRSFHCGLKVGDLYLVKRRNAAIWAGPFGRQRIC